MGRVSSYKIIILTICFTLTSLIIYHTPEPTVARKPEHLSEALANVKGWAPGKAIALPTAILKSLDVDDYVNQNFSNGQATVSLYVGYYLKMNKIGAAHDPLVCFPGQGWIVSNRNEGRYELDDGIGKISYSSFVVRRGNREELVIYWFQSYDQTSRGTFSQKIASLWKKLRHQRGDNAFVRISIVVGERSLSECSKAISQFVSSFYPIFLQYVKD